MPQDTTHRCFIGVPVPAELHPQLRRLWHAVAQGHAVRAVPEANLHMTLVFLGGLSALQRDQVAEQLRTVSLPELPAAQPLTRVGGFPGPNSRVVAAQGDAMPGLLKAREALRSGLSRAGLPAGDGRDFRPHVTLAKRPAGGAALTAQACELELPLRAFVLYESLPAGDSGVVYRSLAVRKTGE